MGQELCHAAVSENWGCPKVCPKFCHFMICCWENYDKPQDFGVPCFQFHPSHPPADRPRWQPPPPLASDEPSPKHPRQFGGRALLAPNRCTKSWVMGGSGDRRAARYAGQLRNRNRSKNWSKESGTSQVQNTNTSVNLQL